MYELVSIMYTVLYSVCVNADLLTPDHVASTLERTDESQYYLTPSRLVCPQCDIEIIVPTKHRLVSVMIEGVQQAQHMDLQIHITRCRAVYQYMFMIKHACSHELPYEMHCVRVFCRHTAPSIALRDQRKGVAENCLLKFNCLFC